MSLLYIIDGCNVVHNPAFKKNFLRKNSDSRVLLIEAIKSERLCGSENNRVFVVFDGYPDASLQSMSGGNLNVIFSFEGSADDKINGIIELSANPRAMAVVSDDKQIILCARAFKAKPVSVEGFISRSVRRRGVKLSRKEEVTFSQMHKINEELKGIWLR